MVEVFGTAGNRCALAPCRSPQWRAFGVETGRSASRRENSQGNSTMPHEKRPSDRWTTNKWIVGRKICPANSPNCYVQGLMKYSTVQIRQAACCGDHPKVTPGTKAGDQSPAVQRGNANRTPEFAGAEAARSPEEAAATSEYEPWLLASLRLDNR